MTQDHTRFVHVPEEGDLNVTITDTVTYENLIPGLEYTVIGTLHVQNTGMLGKIKDEGELKDANGKVITAQTTFKPTDFNGTVDVVFNLSTKDFSAGTLVAFEKVTYNDKVVAEHSDITDEAQSIKFLQPGEPEPEEPDTPNDVSPSDGTPSTPNSSDTPNTPNSSVWEAIKTGQNMFLLAAILGLVLMSGGGYFFFTRTERGRRALERIRDLFSRK